MVQREPMRAVRAYINGLTGWVAGVAMPLDPADPDSWGNQKWRIEFTGNYTFLKKHCYNLVFDGEDLQGNAAGQGNQLLNLPLPVPCAKGLGPTFTVPYRTGPNAWSTGPAQGNDWVHRFQVDDCGESAPPSTECLTARDVDYDLTYADPQTSNGGISLTIKNGFTGLNYTWTNAAGAIIANTQNLSGVAAGVYCLTIKKDCCRYEDCLEIKNCAISATAAVSHPSAGQTNGSISLTVNGGVEPFTYAWSTGSTAPSISGLAVGTYTATVTDFFHCRAIKEATLINCQTITVEANLQDHLPSSCSTSDGWIRIFGAPQAAGGIGPYTWHWENAHGDYFFPNSQGRIDSLSGSIYSLIATDTRGCTGALAHALLPANMPIILHSERPACGTLNNGQLFLLLEGMTAPYDILFDNGQEYFGVTEVDLSNLPAGPICATFTSEDGGCQFSECYEIPQLPVPDIAIAGQVTHNCPGVNNGKIDVSVTGTTNYWIKWGDGSFNQNRANIGAGTYCATVTDNACGTKKEGCFELTPMTSLGISLAPSCEGVGSATVSASGGNLPIQYSWSNGSTAATIYNLHSAPYCTTITDAAGCKIVWCDTLVNWGPIVKSVVQPCKNVNFSGEITLEIHQPQGASIPVVVDGVSFPAQSTAAVYTMVVKNLSKGVHTISMQFVDCIASSTTAPLVEKADDLRLDHFDEDNNLCVYDVYCKDSLLADQGVSTRPLLLTNDAKQFPCRTPRKCGKTNVADLQGQKKKVRAYEYWIVLRDAMGVGAFISEYLEELRIKFLNSGIDWCDKMKYCTATLEPTFDGLNINGDGEVETLSNGCYRLKCGAFGIFDKMICPNDVVPDYIKDFGSDVISCNPLIHNTKQLIFWQDTMRKIYPNYQGSELDIKISEYAHTYNTMPDSLSKWINCSYVIYCSSDFKVLRADEQPPAKCDPSNPPNLPTPYCELDDEDNIICPDNSGNPYPVKIEKEFSKRLYDFFRATSTGKVFTTTFSGNDALYRYGHIISDGHTTPKGLLDQGSQRAFLDYTMRNQWAVREKVPRIEHYLDDWDSNIFTYIEQTHPNQYLVTVDRDSLTWARPFTSTGLLNIKNLTKTSTSIDLNGTFTGEVWYDGTSISSSTDTSLFLIRLHLDGSLQSQQIVRNISTRSGVDVQTT